MGKDNSSCSGHYENRRLGGFGERVRQIAADLFNVCEAWSDKPTDWRNARTSDALHTRSKPIDEGSSPKPGPPWVAIVHGKWHERSAAAWHTHGNFGERAAPSTELLRKVVSPANSYTTPSGN
ncbi:hypothetical protein K0M31_010120 [Melipona bicolor]|uniref:Uncharacterized protein n=1 Tax=Melipona bicolor TaxID=60889 RepID=A0AA40KIN9_9HYME|nr:hypothetical protein K0M31_010120 [Melipona bicolor]